MNIFGMFDMKLLHPIFHYGAIFGVRCSIFECQTSILELTDKLF